MARDVRIGTAVRAAVLVGCAVLIAGMGGLVAGCSVGQGTASASSAANAVQVSATPTGGGRAAAPDGKPDQSKPRVLPVAPGAGRLPQTSAYPSTRGTAWHNAMADMWLAVTTGKASDAFPAFFPEPAYAQVKAIAYPKSDWEDRLWVDFALDVQAAHAVVGSHAKLLRVIMAPSWEAAWVPPGYCYNSAGYWHINGARLVYLKNGQERSIGIASLISWRGVWYVVHFGGVVRPAAGLVDDPEIGPGVPGPAGGC